MPIDSMIACAIAQRSFRKFAADRYRTEMEKTGVRKIHGFLSVMMALSASSLSPASAAAKNYPERPIQLIVPFAAGGSSDRVARLIAQPLGEMLGQPIVVNNRPGAGSQIGVEFVARAEPDGYTLLFGTADGLAIVPATKKVPPYDPVADFAPIAMIAQAPLIIAANTKFPPNSLSELVEYARQNPEKINYGSAGAGSILHLGLALLENDTGTSMVHVPYRGGGPMMTDLIAGNVDIVMTTADFVKTYEDSGQLKSLAQASSTRHPLIPNTPTTAEAGFSDVMVVSWFGLLGPKGMPADAVEKVSVAISEIMSRKDIQDAMVQTGAVAEIRTANDFADHIAKESARWDGIVTDAGIEKLD
ncbi:MAG: Bug family tripartite tricarboxylate transporter substrate binding protein [Pigmentiphaga sp.]